MDVSAWAVVVAAGTGSRMGLGYNKVFANLSGRPVLIHTLEALERSGCFKGIVLVLNSRDMDFCRQAYRQYKVFEGLKAVVAGGDTRQQSVYNGLMQIPQNAQLVAIHDGARPIVSAETIRKTLESARDFGSGIAATRVSDTIKQVNRDESVQSTLDRDSLRAVQTPQSFQLPLILKAYRWAEQHNVQATDDAALLERMGYPVRLCVNDGNANNIKLTTMEDYTMLKNKLEPPSLRVGTGYDVHRLVENRPLILCGVSVPHIKGLQGHSDADVATHALIDTLLGAACLGDIGTLFPDTDSSYKDISSILLLQRVYRKIQQEGWHLGNADITIACQTPKLKAFIPAMRASIEKAIEVQEGSINVKATTTEGLGFEGEGLGISAQASALLLKIL